MNAASAPSPAADTMDALARLRDIRLPEPVPWWPPAPGWWILLALLVAAALVLAGVAWRRRRSLRHAALRELQRLRSDDAQPGSALEAASAICVLVRRVVLEQADGRRLASVHGSDWGAFLAASPDGMPAAVADFIASAPYAPRDPRAGDPAHAAPDRDALFTAAEAWIRAHA